MYKDTILEDAIVTIKRLNTECDEKSNLINIVTNALNSKLAKEKQVLELIEGVTGTNPQYETLYQALLDIKDILEAV